MGSLLSAISGKFAKMIILGTMFPVVIISALNILLVAPLLPQTQALPNLLSKIAVGEEKWSAVMLSLVVFFLTGLLYDLNIPIIRIYEGYPWLNSLTGKGFLRLQRRRFAQAWTLYFQVTSLRKLLLRVSPNDALIKELRGQELALGQFVNSQLPDAQEFLLPTRLGNVIRSFERYPFQAYGMDAIALWPRLVSKIDAAFASTVDESKTSFDFMLNMSFLSSITTLAILTIGLAMSRPLQWTFFLPWVWRALVFALLAMIFYYFSVNRAVSWGVQVKSAFDLYRLDLLKALGYQQKPLSFHEERAIWLKISSQLVYADDRTVPLPYDEPAMRVIPSPPDINIRGRRRFGQQEPNLRIPVVIELQNLDASRAVDSLTVFELLPDGYRYVPNSASVSSGGIQVRRLAPLEFFLGPIAEGGTLRVSYVVKPVSA